MIFMMYLDTYCRESVGNYCYISGAQYVVTFPQPVHNFSFSLNSLSKSEFLSFERKGDGMLDVKGIDVSDVEARRLFDGAETYLRQSDMAGFVLDNLAGLRERIQICVGKRGSYTNLRKFKLPAISPGYINSCGMSGWAIMNVYLFPKEGDPARHGGTIMWHPEMSLPVIDKAEHRPELPWVDQNLGPRRFFKLFKGKRRDKLAAISPGVALIHEMGHAMQYFTCKQQLVRGQDASTYRSLASSEKESDNVAAIENTVVMELNAAGHDEGIRWEYLDLRD